jgi:hypothetical protein
MQHPWNGIPLSDYEAHMSLPDVCQLQVFNEVMKDQLARYPVSSAAILGVAGGNGLEHGAPGKFRRVYGVDVNPDYLEACRSRHAARLEGCLELCLIDLSAPGASLPPARLVIADLLIEYVGIPAFVRLLRARTPDYLSCVIQQNPSEARNAFVSVSPYAHVFGGLSGIHTDVDPQALAQALETVPMKPLLTENRPLPNGKSLLRLDFGRV